MRALTFIIFVLIIFPETTPKSSRAGNICKFKETAEEIECTIMITENEGNIKKEAKCKNKKSKRKGRTIVFNSIFPTNKECEGLVFNISLKLLGRKGKKAKVTDVNWSSVEDKTEDCNLNKFMEDLPKNLKKQKRNGKEQSAFWMKRVSGWKRIHELSIPGTHNTMGYQGTWATIWHLCQSINLRSQLEKGARFFDIRLGVKDRKLGAYHRTFLGSYFPQIMDEFNRFLGNHPSEAIIFRYKHQDGDAVSDSDFCRMFENDVGKHINKVWSQQGNYNSDVKKNYPRLRELRGKIMILRENRNCQYSYGYHKTELDNWNGGIHNPFTGRGGTTDLVDWDWSWVRKETKQATERGKVFSQNGTVKNRFMQIWIKKENELLKDSPGSLGEGQEENSQNETSLNTIAIAGIEEITILSNISDIDVKEMEKIVENERLCNINKTERIYHPRVSTAYKNELTNALDEAKGSRFQNDLTLIWASVGAGAPGGTSPYDPKFFARGVNKHLRGYLDFNWGRTGILVFDYITDWDGDMPFYVFRRNWQSNGCATFYEHGNRQGRSIRIVDEVRNLHHFGWGDRISSFWIAAGCRVYGYDHTYFSGAGFQSTPIRSYATVIDNIGGWNDRASSIRCECYENYLPNI